MKVTVLNRVEFRLMLSIKSLDVDNTDSRDDLCFISITNSDDPPFMERKDNCLPLVFDDITDKDKNIEKYGLILFSPEHAASIISFCANNAERTHMYIHCTGGISRSGAVGAFVNDIWGTESYAEFMLHNPRVYPNSYILSVLNRVYISLKSNEL